LVARPHAPKDHVKRTRPEELLPAACARLLRLLTRAVVGALAWGLASLGRWFG
jgi:hypothetical protein